MPERGAELTAQQLYPKMIKELIGPALQALGFVGDRYVNGDYAGMVGVQKSRYNTKDKVDLTIHLGAEYAPTGYGYWHTRLPGLMPGRHRGWWGLQTGQPMEPVALDVLAAFHAYGWPAILAAVDAGDDPRTVTALLTKTSRSGGPLAMPSGWRPSTMTTQADRLRACRRRLVLNCCCESSAAISRIG